MLKKIFLIIVFVGFIASAIIGYFYYKQFIYKNIVVDKETMIFIPKGSTQDSVINILDNLNLVKDVKSLKWLAEKKNYKNKNVVPGNYILKQNWSNNKLINHLRAGNGRVDAILQFTNVRTLQDLANEMSRNIDPSSEEIYNWLENEENAKKYGFTKETLIAMFLPNTYRVDFDITVEKLMKRMKKEYDKFWNNSRNEKLKNIGLSKVECTTLASIVFSETNSTKDMKTIAGVYMNRIKIGMPLQADPTLIFALNDYSIKRVLNKHKEIDSPYNTYMYSGLPPGPINIPPTRYIDAVLDYEKHDYYYFVAKEDLSGDSYFAKTLKQHLIYAKKYQNMLNKQK